ncbi:hypothetical protein GGTG_03112 [Gaeumannomyces tritici R3-111a-1]|uniref:Uncharacterized protein n=1 Tax=Gaeumannomyces tritici (strain R3-111a-1) TaxID=644352 RepID=J3NPA6_GAET3|nr:hypothetical protein GGTG_03112 [Gaeumannomyces tritici R3-111a-1]EJT78009.1 hypothetical protein GGTG_03112 [Gaeumannomyces tritici R3-111a-1]
MPYLKEPKFPETTSFLLALQLLPLKLLAPKAPFPGANTNAVPLRETAQFNFALDAFLDNGLTFVTRKLFGRYGMEGFGFLDSFAGAKLNFGFGPFFKTI